MPGPEQVEGAPPTLLRFPPRARVVERPLQVEGVAEDRGRAPRAPRRARGRARRRRGGRAAPRHPGERHDQGDAFGTREHRERREHGGEQEPAAQRRDQHERGERKREALRDDIEKTYAIGVTATRQAARRASSRSLRHRHAELVDRDHRGEQREVGDQRADGRVGEPEEVVADAQEDREEREERRVALRPPRSAGTRAGRRAHTRPRPRRRAARAGSVERCGQAPFAAEQPEQREGGERHEPGGGPPDDQRPPAQRVGGHGRPARASVVTVEQLLGPAPARGSLRPPRSGAGSRRRRRRARG